MSERLLTTREVSTYLSVSPETVLRWHRAGKLPGGYRLSSNVLRFDADRIEEWLSSRDEPGVAVEVAPVHLVTPGSRPIVRSAPVHEDGGGVHAR